jgi:hypothetical protein
MIAIGAAIRQGSVAVALRQKRRSVTTDLGQAQPSTPAPVTRRDVWSWPIGDDLAGVVLGFVSIV